MVSKLLLFVHLKNYWSKNMWKDPIVEEIHRIREELAKKSNYDLHVYFEKLRKKESEEDPKLFPNRVK